MKPGDFVEFNRHRVMGKHDEFGMVIKWVPFEERGKDPFPHYMVLFPKHGLLQCRESDLSVIK